MDNISTAKGTDNDGDTVSDSATHSLDMTYSWINVIKLTQGVIDPTTTWTFSLWEGADGYGGALLAMNTTAGDVDGVIDFGNFILNKSQSYTLCEEGIPAGWTTLWQVDTDNDGIPDTITIPYNPNWPADDLGNRCINFGAGTAIDLLTPDGTLVFQVDNTYPGGEPRTPGYWKNWNRCTGGGQQYTADANGGWAEGFWLLEDVLDPSIGGGITWFGTYNITECDRAVSVLDQLDFATGKKMASDAAYTLAMHLLAAQLNFGAGAETCAAAQDAALAAEQLLGEYDFDGTGKYLRPKGETKSDYYYALDIAELLDQYNNGLL
jgi:hypothetical protein